MMPFMKTFQFPLPLRGLAAATVLAACAEGPVAAWAAGVAPTGHGIVTMTRGMRMFGDAETALIVAMKSRDTAALDKLVGPTFEQRSQDAPGAPLARDEWVAQAGAAAAKSTGLQQMAVHDYGDLSVVSFLWTRQAPQASAFVVDVWQRGELGQYVLMTRYFSPLPAASGKMKRPVPPAVDTKK